MVSPERMRLSILLPVRNEGINLRVMLRMLRGMVEVPHEVLVVYDRPDDDSVPVVDSTRPDDTANLPPLPLQSATSWVECNWASVPASPISSVGFVPGGA